MITATNLKYISELVDEIALEKPLDWESFNYDSVKQVAIDGAVETYLNIINNPELNEEEQGMSFLAIVAYLMMENTQLYVEHLRSKQQKE